MTRNALGEFLTARRAALRPEDVGLPGGGRRRTPGLRREEVAVRAGVSADYLARLEQGRDNNPSLAVLEALSSALLLNPEEHHHFSLLAMVAGNESRCPRDQSADITVPETIETVLRALAPTPAFVTGRRLNVLGWNHAWERFVTPLGLLDGDQRPNLAWYTFMDPAARSVLRNWPEVADFFCATLSRAAARWPRDNALTETIDMLRHSPEFDRRWQPHRVSAPLSGSLRLEHPVAGQVEVPFETLRADHDHNVVVWLTDQAQIQAPNLRLVPDRAVNE
ncbi:helix-turn-helix domain-containing protein [Nocardia callitridis]|uniref:Helix-turn-helix transcriptional regulator n=1 Tax=Nocardia callitridis TaxID=648753 RepID=A0ABP9JQI2_9NOCA